MSVARRREWMKMIRVGIGTFKMIEKKWWSRKESCVMDGWDIEGGDDENKCWMS
jgi:hypothetical protein